MKIKNVFLALLFSLLANFSFSQSMSKAQIDSLITGIKKTVIENYVITEKAKLIADSLQAKNYYQVESIDTLIKKLNVDFFRLVNDKHLFIQYKPAVADNLIKHKDIYKEQNRKEKKEHYGFDKPKILEGNIGYIKLNYFADASHANKTVHKYMRRLKSTDALILDLRNNFGGSGSMIQLLTGVFLEGNNNEILKINYHSGRVVTMKSNPIDSGDKLIQKPVYILCSNQTFSAGEAFTLIMKNRNRAIIVGDTTAGAGNVAGPYAINNLFVLTVPVGIIVDPLTNIGWEHTGVVPVINCDSPKALERAITDILNKKQSKKEN